MTHKNTVTIAYADDQVAVRKCIVAFLEGLGGIEVPVQAGNGQELIDKLKGLQELPDAVMLDINMPIMDGFEAMAEIKERWPDLKVLVLTIHNTELYIIRMIALGANGYLLKNCDPQDIKQALQTVCRHDYYYSTTASSRMFHKVQNGQIKPPHFTDHEVAFLKQCPTDLSYSEIAKQLQTTTKAIEGYRDRLCEKLGVTCRVSLAMYAVQFGLYQINMKIKPDSLLFSNHKGATH